MKKIIAKPDFIKIKNCFVEGKVKTMRDQLYIKENICPRYIQ